MSQNQWSVMMKGDEAYAGAKSYFYLKEVIDEIFGFPYFIPTHQGRAAENILATCTITPGDYIPSNMHFDTTDANIRAKGGNPVNCIIEKAYQPNIFHPFKGNMDLLKLQDFIEKVGAEKVPFGMITITNNAGGGQPVSLENLRGVSKIYKKFGIPFFIDGCRFAENAYFIKLRELGYSDKTILEICQEIFALADGTIVSAKKDGLANIGGFLAVRDPILFEKVNNELILREGFTTYGGLAGRDLSVIATGLREVIQEDYLAYRLGQTNYLADRVQELGIPIITPPGAHALYINAGLLLPHIPPIEFPGQALAVELYLEGGIRTVEIGSFVFAHPHPDTGEIVHPPFELVRLAIPRRVYTQSHLDYVAEMLAQVIQKRKQIPSYKIVSAPKLLRHFTGKLEPILSSRN